MLDGYKYKSLWTTHIGCIKGAVDYLKLDISTPWVFGGTGHAFVMNVHEELCPSGPTAWKTLMLFELAPNLGYKTDGILAFKDDHADGCTKWADAAEAAWEFTKRKLNENIPVYAWEMKVPEYYCVHGYDDIGYYFNGCLADEGEGPVPWKDTDKREIGLIEFVAVHPGEPAPPNVAVKAALEKAIMFATNPGDLRHPGYHSGVGAYDAWIKFLDGSYDYSKEHCLHGNSYNAEVWRECRKFAVDYLYEAKDKVGDHGALFDEAIGHYSDVRDNMECLARQYPFLTRQPDHLTDENRRAEATKYLQQARDAEEQGLNALDELVKVL